MTYIPPPRELSGSYVPVELFPTKVLFVIWFSLLDREIIAPAPSCDVVLSAKRLFTIFNESCENTVSPPPSLPEEVEAMLSRKILPEMIAGPLREERETPPADEPELPLNVLLERVRLPPNSALTYAPPPSPPATLPLKTFPVKTMGPGLGA